MGWVQVPVVWDGAWEGEQAVCLELGMMGDSLGALCCLLSILHQPRSQGEPRGREGAGCQWGTSTDVVLSCIISVEEGG